MIHRETFARNHCLILYQIMHMKPSVFLLLSSLLFHLMTSAQQYTLPLYPAGQVPNWRDAGEQELTQAGDITLISKVQQPAIGVYLPAKRVATGQAVLVCPGGGYGVLAYDWEGTDIAKWLNSKGIAAIVLKYRLPNTQSNIIPHLTPLMDAERAMRMVRANASRWNIQPNRIGVMGFSAGGHLASTLGTHFSPGKPDAADTIDQQSSRPDFMVLVYPVITMDEKITHGGSRSNLLGAAPSADLIRRYSNELQVNAQTPPTFLLHATDDKGVPVENSLLFYQALKNHSVPAEMHIYPYGGHGFSLAIGKGYLQTWTDRCIDWMTSLAQ